MTDLKKVNIHVEIYSYNGNPMFSQALETPEIKMSNCLNSQSTVEGSKCLEEVSSPTLTLYGTQMYCTCTCMCIRDGQYPCTCIVINLQ